MTGEMDMITDEQVKEAAKKAYDRWYEDFCWKAPEFWWLDVGKERMLEFFEEAAYNALRAADALPEDSE